MKVALIMMAFVIASINMASAQKIKEYKANNGTVYKIGDKVKLKKGSGENGSFVFLTVGGWATIANPNIDTTIPSSYAGYEITVKKIKQAKGKTLFVVSGGNISNYYLLIDQAIESGEV